MKEEENKDLYDENGALQGETPSPDYTAFQEKFYKDSGSYQRNELPVDRGWAWVLCFAGFVCTFNTGLAIHTRSILFLAVMEKFETSLTTASIIFLASTLSISLMSSFSTNVILPRVGEKAVVCTSGFVSVLASVGFFFSPNFEVFLFFTAIKGLCIGACLVPRISLMRHYFHRRRSIALILARVGDCTAAIAMPRFILALQDMFGVRGAYLIIGGIELHIVLAGLLLRPVASYKFKPELPPLSKGKKEKKKDKITANKTHDSQDEEMTLMENKCPADDAGDNTIPCPAGLQQQPGHSPNTESRGTAESERSYDKNGSVETNPNNMECEVNMRKQSGENGKLLTSEPAFRELERGQESQETTRAPGKTRRERTISVMTADEADLVGGDGDQADVGESDKEETSCSKRYSFLRSWSFRMVLLYTALGATNPYIKNYIPAISVSQGATLEEAAILITMMGVLDLVSRLCVGLFADTHLLKPTQIVAISQLIMGVTCHLVQFFTTFPTLVVMAVFFGLTMGLRMTMLPLVTIEVVGVEMMPQAMSFFTTVSTFMSASLNPILSAFAESCGSFVPALHVCGACLIVASNILLMLPLFHRLDKKKTDTSI